MTGRACGRRRLWRALAAGAAVASLVWFGRRRLAAVGHRVGGRLRWVSDRCGGIIHSVTFTGHQPVDDATLADRIRSSLGRLEHDLDTPRVHVTVEEGVAILHGEVPDDAVAGRQVLRTGRVPGVLAVRSQLSAGPIRPAARPSWSAEHSAPSALLA